MTYDVQAYNYTSNSYETIGTLNVIGPTEQTHEYNMYADHRSGLNSAIRLYVNEMGNPTHYTEFDYIAIGHNHTTEEEVFKLNNDLGECMQYKLFTE